MSQLTIVMYHYVRPRAGSRYPEIKALDKMLFTEQLDYIARHYVPVTACDVMNALNGDAQLPKNALLLTFDDGYRDHYDHVLPELTRRAISGAFYPPANAVLNREILDVNKIQFVLASEGDKPKLVADINRTIDSARKEYGLLSPDEYRAQCPVDRYDTPDVVYIKRVLQMLLPQNLRARIVDDLFAKFVSADEKTFADELYLSNTQLREMVDARMHVGAHGAAHYWLDSLDRDAQIADIDASRSFLDGLGVAPHDFSFCYPYGAYNVTTLELLRARACRFALTTKPDIAQLKLADSLTLPRLDTNDLPKSARAHPNDWTLRATSM